MLTSENQCLVWGNISSYTGKLSGAKSYSSKPTDIRTLLSNEISCTAERTISDVYLMMDQIILEVSKPEHEVVHMEPFIVQVEPQAIELIGQILRSLFESTNGECEFVPSETEENITVALINVLTLQLSIAMKKDSLTSKEFCEKVFRTKDIICHFACSQNVLESIQEAAHKCLKICWPILLPTSQERTELLLQLLQAQTKDENSLFLIDLLISSLLSKNELEAEIETIIGKVSRVVKKMPRSVDVLERYRSPSKFVESDGLSLDTSEESELNCTLDLATSILTELDPQIIKLMSILIEFKTQIGSDKTLRLLSRFIRLLFREVISRSIGNDSEILGQCESGSVSKTIAWSLILRLASELLGNVTLKLNKILDCSKKDALKFAMLVQDFSTHSSFVVLREVMVTVVAVIKSATLSLPESFLNDLQNLCEALRNVNQLQTEKERSYHELSETLNIFDASKFSFQCLTELPKVADSEVMNHNVLQPHEKHLITIEDVVYRTEFLKPTERDILNDFMETGGNNGDSEIPEKLLKILQPHIKGKQCEKSEMYLDSEKGQDLSQFVSLEQIANFLIGYSCSLRVSKEVKSVDVQHTQNWAERLNRFGLKQGTERLQNFELGSICTEVIDILKFAEEVSDGIELNIESYVNAIITVHTKMLAETREEVLIAKFLERFWISCRRELQCVKFETGHALEELSLLVLALLMKHQGMIPGNLKEENPLRNQCLKDNAKRLV